MECFELDTKIISYVNRQLDDDELDAFLQHIKTCKRCRDEVELFFTLTEGISQMESDEITVYDFPEEFESRRMQQMKDVVGRKSARKVADRFVILIVLSIIFAGFLYGVFHIFEYQMDLFSYLIASL